MSPLVDWFLWIGKYVASFKRCLNQQLFGRLAIERVSGMQPLNVQRFSLAFGVASALLYLGCVVFMAILGKQTTIIFFNSLLHGLDVRLIIRMDVPFQDTIIGIIETFILGWLFGVVISVVYNWGTEKKS